MCPYQRENTQIWPRFIKKNEVFGSYAMLAAYKLSVFPKNLWTFHSKLELCFFS